MRRPLVLDGNIGRILSMILSLCPAEIPLLNERTGEVVDASPYSRTHSADRVSNQVSEVHVHYTEHIRAIS